MKLWLLWVVPDSARGRWLTAAVIFTVLFGAFWWAGILATSRARDTWHIALFFCVIVAYIVPIFQFITRRTEEAFDDLRTVLELPADELQHLRQAISCRSGLWVAVNLALGTSAWLAQSYIFAGSFSGMMSSLTGSVFSAAMALGSLAVWLTVTCAVHALVDNARLFHALTQTVDVNVLDSARLNPFGRMAVSSTLMIVGAQASFAIMWLGPSTDPWTTIPGVIATTVPMIFLLLAPVWPLHRRLREAKRGYLASLQTEINMLQGKSYDQLAPLLAVRREVASVPEWPFDLGIVTRLGLYLFIVPLTWIGAALIEMLVETFVS